jgi:cell division protein FtsQ
VVLLPLLLLAALLAIYNLPYLQVSRVEIVGAQNLDIAEIRSSLKLEGKNLLSINSTLIEKTLAQNPIVKSVQVHRRFPDKVILNIEERKPFALWQTREGLFVVDREGVVLGDAIPARPLLTIVAEDSDLRVGSQVPARVMALAQDLAVRLPDEVGITPSEFHYSPSQGLAVVTKAGWRAVFGDERDLSFKLAVLGRLLEKAKEERLELSYIDLRYGYRPYLRLR